MLVDKKPNALDSYCDSLWMVRNAARARGLATGRRPREAAFFGPMLGEVAGCGVEWGTGGQGCERGWRSLGQ